MKTSYLNRTIGILLLIFFIPQLVAQPKKADSLVTVLNTKKLSSDETLLLYQNLFSAYMRFDVNNALVYAEKGLKFAEKENDKLRASIFHERIGRVYNIKLSYDTALVHFEKALNLAVKIKDKEQEAAVYIGIGNLYNEKSDYTNGLEYYMKALAICDSMGNKRQQMNISCNIATVYRTLSNFDRAIYYLEKANALAEELGNDNIKSNVYVGLEDIYEKRGEMDKALNYGLKAVEISRIMGDKSSEIMSLHSVSMHYLNAKVKAYDKALEYANNCLQVAEEYGEPYELQGTYALLSNVYFKQKRYNEAETMAIKSLEMDSTKLDQALTALSVIIFSNIYLGNKDKAANYYRKYIDLTKKYSNDSYQESMVKMEVKYETEKKELRIQALEKEKKLTIWLGVACIIVFLLILGLLLIRHRMNVQKHKLVEQQVKQFEQEKQLIATQSVLDGEAAERSRLARDLHDGLGGMLSVVKLNLKEMKNYSILDAPDVGRFNNALEMLDQSIGELRRVAHHMMPESLMRYGLKVSLEDFCHAIPGAHFQYLGEGPRLDSRLEVLIYRCTYELVNNAVKHANATDINVQLMIDNGLISLSVHDNGIGFDPETVILGSGLENIRTRISVYNGKMTVYSTPGEGTEINIEIELL